MFDRLSLMLSKEKINEIKSKTVLLVGIGGVGGITLEMLVRAGISNIIVVDYDVFEESNLNRQILCTINNIGKYKTDEAEKRILSINPNCNIKKYNVKLNEAFLNNFNSKVDYIIDACDDLNAKVSLIKYSIKENIKIISCCGTGNKIKPEMLEISNIWKTSYDPLAKALRTRLKNEGIYNKIPVVFSKEEVLIKKSGPIPSISLVPNSAGILLASYVINDILKDE